MRPEQADRLPNSSLETTASSLSSLDFTDKDALEKVGQILTEKHKIPSQTVDPLLHKPPVIDFLNVARKCGVTGLNAAESLAQSIKSNLDQAELNIINIPTHLKGQPAKSSLEANIEQDNPSLEENINPAQANKSENQKFSGNTETTTAERPRMIEFTPNLEASAQDTEISPEQRQQLEQIREESDAPETPPKRGLGGIVSKIVNPIKNPIKKIIEIGNRPVESLFKYPGDAQITVEMHTLDLTGTKLTGKELEEEFGKKGSERSPSLKKVRKQIETAAERIKNFTETNPDLSPINESNFNNLIEQSEQVAENYEASYTPVPSSYLLEILGLQETHEQRLDDHQNRIGGVEVKVQKQGEKLKNVSKTVEKHAENLDFLNEATKQNTKDIKQNTADILKLHQVTRDLREDLDTQGRVLEQHEEQINKNKEAIAKVQEQQAKVVESLKKVESRVEEIDEELQEFKQLTEQSLKQLEKESIERDLEVIKISGKYTDQQVKGVEDRLRAEFRQGMQELEGRILSSLGVNQAQLNRKIEDLEAKKRELERQRGILRKQSEEFNYLVSQENFEANLDRLFYTGIIAANVSTEAFNSAKSFYASIVNDLRKTVKNTRKTQDRRNLRIFAFPNLLDRMMENQAQLTQFVLDKEKNLHFETKTITTLHAFNELCKDLIPLCARGEDWKRNKKEILDSARALELPESIVLKIKEQLDYLSNYDGEGKESSRREELVTNALREMVVKMSKQQLIAKFEPLVPNEFNEGEVEYLLPKLTDVTSKDTVVLITRFGTKITMEEFVAFVEQMMSNSNIVVNGGSLKNDIYHEIQDILGPDNIFAAMNNLFGRNFKNDPYDGAVLFLEFFRRFLQESLSAGQKPIQAPQWPTINLVGPNSENTWKQLAAYLKEIQSQAWSKELDKLGNSIKNMIGEMAKNTVNYNPEVLSLALQKLWENLSKLPQETKSEFLNNLLRILEEKDYLSSLTTEDINKILNGLVNKEIKAGLSAYDAQRLVRAVYNYAGASGADLNNPNSIAAVISEACKKASSNSAESSQETKKDIGDLPKYKLEFDSEQPRVIIGNFCPVYFSPGQYFKTLYPHYPDVITGEKFGGEWHLIAQTLTNTLQQASPFGLRWQGSLNENRYRVLELEEVSTSKERSALARYYALKGFLQFCNIWKSEEILANLEVVGAYTNPKAAEFLTRFGFQSVAVPDKDTIFCYLKQESVDNFVSRAESYLLNLIEKYPWLSNIDPSFYDLSQADAAPEPQASPSKQSENKGNSQNRDQDPTDSGGGDGGNGYNHGNNGGGGKKTTEGGGEENPDKYSPFQLKLWWFLLNNLVKPVQESHEQNFEALREKIQAGMALFDPEGNLDIAKFCEIIKNGESYAISGQNSQTIYHLAEKGYLPAIPYEKCLNQNPNHPDLEPFLAERGLTNENPDVMGNCFFATQLLHPNSILTKHPNLLKYFLAENIGGSKDYAWLDVPDFFQEIGMSLCDKSRDFFSDFYRERISFSNIQEFISKNPDLVDMERWARFTNAEEELDKLANQANKEIKGWLIILGPIPESAQNVAVYTDWTGAHELATCFFTGEKGVSIDFIQAIVPLGKNERRFCKEILGIKVPAIKLDIENQIKSSITNDLIRLEGQIEIIKPEDDIYLSEEFKNTAYVLTFPAEKDLYNGFPPTIQVFSSTEIVGSYQQVEIVYNGYSFDVLKAT